MHVDVCMLNKRRLIKMFCSLVLMVMMIILKVIMKMMTIC